eukprot:TRINITY_DN67659_c7_g2_i1.p1 TRINITY_DN67659_c7_g2~~TRINITY_DN67659_c7_g2_i1.p1  ORF type:complete len:168 (-),score=69.50 TRINITY_DN67659_c7_g2_i1:452-955(-)
MLDLGPKGLSVATLILVGLTVLCLIFAGTRLAPWVVCSETREGCDRDCLDDARRPAHLTVSACLSGCRDVHTNCDNGTLSSAIILVFSSVVQILSLWLLYYSHYRDVKREYGSFQDFVAQRLGDTVFYVIDSVKDCFSCCRSSSDDDGDDNQSEQAAAAAADTPNEQ